MSKRIAIIGAGWTGIGCLSMLASDGSHRIDDMQMSVLKKYNDECSVIGETQCFTHNGIKLKNGKDIHTDCVIFCTGSSFSKHLVPITVDDMPFPIENVDKMYRSRIIPDLPNLIFTAFSDFTYGTVNGLIYGKWILNYISKNLSVDDLKTTATQYKTPFFNSCFLFNSDEYFLDRELGMLDAFIENQEISKSDLKNGSINMSSEENQLNHLRFYKLHQVRVTQINSSYY